jgi:hypothetical protein
MKKRRKKTRRGTLRKDLKSGERRLLVPSEEECGDLREDLIR